MGRFSSSRKVAQLGAAGVKSSRTRRDRVKRALVISAVASATVVSAAQITDVLYAFQKAPGNNVALTDMIAGHVDQVSFLEDPASAVKYSTSEFKVLVFPAASAESVAVSVAVKDASGMFVPACLQEIDADLVSEFIAAVDGDSFEVSDLSSASNSAAAPAADKGKGSLAVCLPNFPHSSSSSSASRAL